MSQPNDINNNDNNNSFENNHIHDPSDQGELEPPLVGTAAAAATTSPPYSTRARTEHNDNQTSLLGRHDDFYEHAAQPSPSHHRHYQPQLNHHSYHYYGSRSNRGAAPDHPRSYAYPNQEHHQHHYQNPRPHQYQYPHNYQHSPTYQYRYPAPPVSSYASYYRNPNPHPNPEPYKHAQKQSSDHHASKPSPPPPPPPPAPPASKPPISNFHPPQQSGYSFQGMEREPWFPSTPDRLYATANHAPQKTAPYSAPPRFQPEPSGLRDYSIADTFSERPHSPFRGDVLVKQESSPSPARLLEAPVMEERSPSPLKFQSPKRQAPIAFRKPSEGGNRVKDISHNDVLCGRGAPVNFHPGNRDFQVLVEQRQTEYLCARRSDKPRIATFILEEIKSRGGRFLKRVKDRQSTKYNGSDTWEELGDYKAYEKVCQSLREGAPEIRKKMISKVKKSTKDGFSNMLDNSHYPSRDKENTQNR